MSIRLSLFLLCLAAAAVAIAQPPRPVRRDYLHGAQEFFRLKRAPVGERAIPVERYFAARVVQRGIKATRAQYDACRALAPVRQRR